ncbi:hypothetical protein EX30DRAFT_373365 [Ascodesmis nigricans]|uniref:Uncharacterized protein n=1 Tax=Ascodesmis nigricans TaxID=341454 RepID=A0A4S2MPP6_9PEZI|nr:hypothetical protein EX30DRAFT_373365 [Ascodesmis nigricans]
MSPQTYPSRCPPSTDSSTATSNAISALSSPPSSGAAATAPTGAYSRAIAATPSTARSTDPAPTPCAPTASTFSSGEYGPAGLAAKLTASQRAYAATARGELRAPFPG